MLASDTYVKAVRAVAIDEAHVICHWKIQHIYAVTTVLSVANVVQRIASHLHIHCQELISHAIHQLRERNVSGKQRKTLENKLAQYHKQLLTNLTKRDSSGKLKYFTHPKFLLGFSELQSPTNICSLVETWDLMHAYKIHGIMQEIFGDLEDTDMGSEDEMSDEEEECWSNDWNDLALDDELANMVIDNLSFSQWDDSQEESVENATG
ncbi:hypothetical protein OS493_031421 [Desmophyllum pertusum]|uniref:Uncharacterized protein n=1 Tax=Desmophyllum pertusum TaxID=174260 RepID=A0A9W9ZX20_9CNID|nr:hypothetical protein OS493_031421 [Desmophyllum pertusum]